MKTTIIFTSILFLFVSISIAQAQVEVRGSEDLLTKLRINKSIEGIKNDTYLDVEGNPYMFEDFHSGKIKLKDDGIYDEMTRFDKYAGEIQFKRENDIYAIAFPEKIEFVEIDDLRFIYSDFKMSESATAGDVGAYFVVLLEDKCKLLAQKSVSIKGAQQSKGIVEAKPAKFMDKSDAYFIKVDDLPAVGIDGKKNLNLFFESKDPEILEFIKKEKIKSNDSNDLMKLVKFYNQQLK